MANAQYTIKLVTSIGLVVGDLVYVYFPHQYSIAVGSIPCAASSPSSAVSASPTCTVADGNIIKISSFLTASAPSPI